MSLFPELINTVMPTLTELINTVMSILPELSESSDKDISESSDLLFTDTYSHYVRNVEDNYKR